MKRARQSQRAPRGRPTLSHATLLGLAVATAGCASGNLREKEDDDASPPQTPTLPDVPTPEETPTATPPTDCAPGLVRVAGICRAGSTVIVTDVSSGQDLQEYQLELVFDGSDLDYTRFAADGSDLRPVDARTGEALPFYLAAWNPGGTSRVWVRIASLEAGDSLPVAVVVDPGLAGSDFDAVFTRDFGKDSSLEAEWLFDEGQGATAADGRGTDRNPATLYNGAGWSATDGGQWGDEAEVHFATGSALELDGQTHFARAAYSLDLALFGPRTIELWVYAATPARRGRSYLFEQRGYRDSGGLDHGQGDGWPDLWVGNYSDSSFNHNIESYLYYGSTWGYSPNARESLPSHGARGVAVADLNEDGFLDLAIASYYDNSSMQLNSYVYWGRETGYSADDRLELPTLGAQGICIEDIDRDGFWDLLFANHRDGTYHSTLSYLYWGSAAGFDTGRVTKLPSHGASSCQVADLNADGLNDLVIANNDNDETYALDSYVYWGAPEGFTANNRLELPTLGAKASRAADLNQDGWLDLVFSNFRSDYDLEVPSYIYWGSATGFRIDARTELPTRGGLGNAVADLNRDGWLDIVFANGVKATGELDSYIYLGSADGFSETRRMGVPNMGPDGTLIEDLNRDGYLDLFFANLGDQRSDYASNIYWGDASGTYSAANRTTLPTISATGAAVAGGSIPTGINSEGQQPSLYGSIGLYVEADGRLEATFHDFQHRPHRVGTPVELDRWHHVALVLEEDHLALYLDGGLVDEVRESLEVAGAFYRADPSLGADNDNQRKLLGMLDEVRIYSRALSEAEVLRHYYRARYVKTSLQIAWDHPGAI